MSDAAGNMLGAWRAVAAEDEGGEEDGGLTEMTSGGSINVGGA